MERDNQAPIELTGQTQSTYSNSMSENAGESGPGIEVRFTDVDPSDRGQRETMQSILDNDAAPEGLREDAKRILSGSGVDVPNNLSEEEMDELEKRSSELSDDASFQDLMQDEALKLLRAKDEGRWFKDKFKDELDEDGRLVDRQNNDLKTLPTQEIGTEIVDVTKSALDRYDRIKAEEEGVEEAKAGEDESGGDESGGGVDEKPPEGAPVAKEDEPEKDGAPVEDGDSHRRIESIADKDTGDPKPKDEKERAERFYKELEKHLSKSGVQKLLESETPNFHQIGIDKESDEYSDDVADFVRFIDKDIKPSGGRGFSTLEAFVHVMSEEKGIDIFGKKGEEDVHIKTSDVSRELLFEWMVEKIISIPDITPDSPYRLDMYAESERNTLIQTAVTKFDKEFMHKMGKLAEVRKDFHELRHNLPNGEAYKKNLFELRTNGLHYASNEMSGVAQALRYHERLNSGKLAKVKTWFSSEDIGDIDKQVEARMRTQWEAGELKKDGRVLTEWEFDRAVAIAKTFFNGTQRQSIYEGAGEVPAAGTSRIASTKNEFISRSIYPFKTAAIRYFAANESARTLLRRFTGRRMEQEDETYKEKNGEAVGSRSLFGIKRETMIVNQMGAPDFRSHGWRNPIMHFSGIKINRGEAGNISLLEFLNENGGHVDDSTFDPGHSKLNETSDVEASILGQTLNISALVGYEALSKNLRTNLWKKRAIQNPASIAAFSPDIIQEGEQDMWDAITPHLDVAFSTWVDNEFENKYKDGMSMEDLRAERTTFLKGLRSEEYRYQILNQDYINENLNDSQKELLKKVIDRGIGRADYLSEAKLWHIYDLDDTPYVSWSTDEEKNTRGLDNPNMFRLINDQANLQEKGWAHLIPMFSNLTNAKNFEWAKESVQGLSMVLGLAKAQEWNEPMAMAVIDMMKAYKGRLWFGENWRLAGMPMSEFEKYTGDRIFLDEEGVANTLESLGANSVIPAEGGRKSRVNQLKGMMGGTEKHKWKGKARGILQILLLVIPASIAAAVVKEANEGLNES